MAETRASVHECLPLHAGGGEETEVQTVVRQSVLSAQVQGSRKGGGTLIPSPTLDELCQVRQVVYQFVYLGIQFLLLLLHRLLREFR